MRPVFVFGCDRSGTTYLGSLLGTHSRCLATPESQFVYGDPGRYERDDGFDLEAAVAALRRNFRFQLWNIDLRADEARARGVSSYAALIAFAVDVYARAVGRAGAEVWVDHTPNNCEHAVFLATLFPDARFIHLVRDGRAVTASLKGLPWRYHGVGKICRLWVGKVGQGLAAETHFGPARCRRVRYEDLVGSPEDVLRDLAPFLGLSYEPQMLTGRGFGPPAFTEKQHALVGQPADPTRIGAWEDRLSSREVELFESLSGDMLAYLGYPVKFGVRARQQTRWERYRERLVDVLYYRRLDGFKERRRRHKTLARLQAAGYLNARRVELAPDEAGTPAQPEFTGQPAAQADAAPLAHTPGAHERAGRRPSNPSR